MSPRASAAAQGAHPALPRGSAAEFAHYRAYRQGDDPRRLDWRLLARTDRAYVRLSTDRAVQPTTIIVDASASMAFPPDSLTKWRHACAVAAGLVSVSLATGDPVALIVDNGAFDAPLPPRIRRSVLADVVGRLNETEPAGAARVGDALLAARTKRIVVVSDFLSDEDALLNAMRASSGSGKQLLAVHVIAREELQPPAVATVVVDPETRERRGVLVPRGHAGYLDRFARWRRELASSWRAAGGTWVETISDERASAVVRRCVAAGPAFSRT